MVCSQYICEQIFVSLNFGKLCFGKNVSIELIIVIVYNYEIIETKFHVIYESIKI